MKKTFNILGAAVLGAAVLFGTSSCTNAKSNTGNEVAGTDSTLVAGVPAGAVVYIDMTKLMAEYQMAIDLTAEVNKKIEELEKPVLNKKAAAEKEIKRKQDNLQTKMKDFEDKYSKGLYTETVAQTKYQELQKLDQELNNYGVTKEQELAQEASKVQTLISDELIVMNNKINDAINTFIQKYRAEKGYAMILINQSDADKTDKAMILNSLVLAADPSLDVTADVLAGLNAEYNAAK
jgi:outer membrane protein